VRVPFFIYSEKFGKKNTVSNNIISSLDLFPTLLDLAAIPIPDYLQGKSLKPVLSDPSARVRDYMVSESVGVGGELGTGHRMVVTDSWKYMVSDTGEEALFNLNNDLYELKNLIKGNEYLGKASELKTSLKEWKKLTGDKKN
jgi:arylsulfatase A-like enzyme